MDHKRMGDTIYVRLDKGDEIISSLLDLCEKEQISSATFSGIGGCSEAVLQTFQADTNTFESQTIQGMLELISLNGNIIQDDQGQLYPHTHALFSFKKDGQHGTAAGHVSSITVLYTAEIELRPVIGGTIYKKYDPETGTGFWDFR